ncbi:hypothetical protein [Pyrobaculum aerophilum]|uniref:Uncharacterized protein n=1 Tax=Pyrobaculum aerophilum TaxID=13773 RepID=A0A371QXE3_9CREN|nr:hypothetical protein [Pyrobaculum aerophilum]RFA95018.1 hypothetical protein CGL51_08525 [Pyrobaculum aerophilum]RFA96730.1 hypothetical protein CGL52_10550 [Pyrobaculum aerophilum]
MFIKPTAKINRAKNQPKPQRYSLILDAFFEWLSSISPKGTAFKVTYEFCGESVSCIKTVHSAVQWAVDRGLVVGAVKLPRGWLIPTDQLLSLKAAVLMYKAVVEKEGRIRP